MLCSMLVRQMLYKIMFLWHLVLGFLIHVLVVFIIYLFIYDSS